MFAAFFAFELRYFLRGWMVWIFLLIVAGLLFGAASSDNVTVGGGIGSTNRNAPWVVENFYAVSWILTLLMTTAFVNNSATRDFTFNTHQMIFSLPVKKSGFLLGRFAGATLIGIIPALGTSVGILLARYAPWADQDRFGPDRWRAHLDGIIGFAIPNAIFIGAVLFGIALLFRSTVVSLLSALLMLVLVGVANSMMSDMKNETVAALLDPFGTRAFGFVTKYWTVAERNAHSLPLSGVFLWNRLIWVADGLGVFAVIASTVTLGERASRKKKRTVELAETEPQAPELEWTRPSWSGSPRLAQFLGSLRFEMKGLLKSPVFVVVLAAGLVNCGFSLALNSGESFGNRTFPVTYWATELIQGTLYMFLMAIITFFAGQLVWRDRDERMDEIRDCLPMRDWLFYTSKLLTLLIAIFAIMLVAILAGVIVQVSRGYTRFQLDVYAQQILLRDFSQMASYAVAAFFLHVVMPNKYVGYFAFIAYFIADNFIWDALDWPTKMVRFAATPDVPYSDFYRYAPASPGWEWFTLYWGLACLLIALASILFYRRGKESSWARRLRVAGQRLDSPLRIALLLSLVAFAATASWVYYNTKVLNSLISPDEQKRRRADYEKQYKKYEKLAQPRVSAIRYAIDLYPERRGFVMRGDETIRNTTDRPLDQIHFTVDPESETEIQFPGSVPVKNDKRLSYRILRITAPMQPGESRQLHFTVQGGQKGFSNDVTLRQFVQNGTFFDNGIAPQIGYQSSGELSDKNDRRKQGLKEKDLMPALERNCTADCMNSYLSNNSDLVSVESVISTSPDQIAIAPGSLVREWSEKGRRYFQYKLDQDSGNYYAFLSARYAVARDEWNGVKVEVYYLPEHSWNVPRMTTAIKKSIEYYTANYGPYYMKQARIIEFPRIARFAQAFPGTMPYSESIGFIADLRDPNDIDHVSYVVAHEMGHQWWAYQVIGANMQGATILSETLAEYSALMVMERKYGRDLMRRFLEYEMDGYLRARGTERLKERPLERVDSIQGYIHYRKGSVVMYYLKEMIGEQAVDRALQGLVDKFAYRPPPYPTSYELVDRLRDQTPPQFRYLIKDLFEDITLFSNRAIEASARKLAGGKYEVTLKVESRKFKADEKGNEKEVPVSDWIEIGAFAKPEKGSKFGKTLYREQFSMDRSSSTYRFLVDEVPDKAGIDPFHLLIDRTPDDNTKSVALRRTG